MCGFAGVVVVNKLLLGLGILGVMVGGILLGFLLESLEL